MPLPRLVLAALVAGIQPGHADVVVATRTIPARSIIEAADLELRSGAVDGAASHPSDLIGQEARITIFAGRPVRQGDVVRPALVERNGAVTLVYRTAGLMIEAEGRGLRRAVAGDTIRVLNTGSRIVVTGRVAPDGKVEVGPIAIGSGVPDGLKEDRTE